MQVGRGGGAKRGVGGRVTVGTAPRLAARAARRASFGLRGTKYSEDKNNINDIVTVINTMQAMIMTMSLYVIQCRLRKR